MELRKTEEGLSNLIQDYQCLCLRPLRIADGNGSGNDGNDNGNVKNGNDDNNSDNQHIPDLIMWEDLLGMRKTSIIKEGEKIDNGIQVQTVVSPSPVTTTTSAVVVAHHGDEISVKEALQTLIHIRDSLISLHPTILKFQTRLSMVDPVTKAPRYGKKTIERVERLLERYEALKIGIDHAFDSNSDSNIPNNGESGSDDNSSCPPSKTKTIVEALQQSIQNEEEQIQKRKMEEEATLSKMEQERRKNEEDAKIQLQIKQREEEEAREKEREELARRAEEARRLRILNEQRALEEEREADRRFLQSVAVGVDGVKAQLQILRESCANNKSELKVALTALHTIFSQISSRPEEIQFRRIRRDHPKFLEDIGRHKGGKEVLIAAGFIFKEVDGVKCFFSSEPDLETDMDGWSSWFDLIKATTTLLDEELTKI